MSSPITIGWSFAGDLRVDDIVEDQPVITVHFLALRNKPRLEKLEILLEIVQTAMNTPELTEDK